MAQLDLRVHSVGEELVEDLDQLDHGGDETADEEDNPKRASHPVGGILDELDALQGCLVREASGEFSGGSFSFAVRVWTVAIGAHP